MAGGFKIGRGRPTAGGAVPASIASPVVGTDLTAVHNLQHGGTGIQNAPSNGTWSGSLNSYLIANGFAIGNNGDVYWNVGTATKAISRYDFTGLSHININGTTGSASLTDCTYGPTTSLAFPVDTNGNVDYDTGTVTVVCTNCTFTTATFFMGSGTCTHSYCRFTGQLQGLGDVGFGGLGQAVLTYDHCYITGGGVAVPVPLAHVELTQFSRGGTPSGCQFNVTNCLIDISRDGQTTTVPWGSAWTGVWYIHANIPTIFTNCIMIGAPAVNANPANPDVVNCVVAYVNSSVAITITNCVMEIGRYGYTFNQDAGATRPIDGGGNRSFANAALTVASFG